MNSGRILDPASETLTAAEEKLRIAIIKRRKDFKRSLIKALKEADNENRIKLKLSTQTGIEARLFHRLTDLNEIDYSLSLESSFESTKEYVKAAISNKRQGQLKYTENWLRAARKCAPKEMPTQNCRVVADLDLALSALLLCGGDDKRYAEAEQLCVNAICQYRDLRIDQDDDNVKLAHELIEEFGDESS